MVDWGSGAKGAATGATFGSVLGPYGAALGGVIGGLGGLFSGGGDSPAPVTAGPAPQIDPNAGIGYGYGAYGGLSQQEQQTIAANSTQYNQAQTGYSQQSDAINKQIADLQSQAGNQSFFGQQAIQMQIQALQQKQSDLQAQAKSMPTPDYGVGLDPLHFSSLANSARNQAAPQVGQVNIDPSAGAQDSANFGQDRAQLGTVADAIRQRALGQGGPSVAELQLGQGRDMAMANAMSIANSQRGGGGSLGTIEALRSQAGSMAQFNQQAAMLRAQEQMGAQGQYGNLMNAQQAQDLAARGQSFNQANNAAQFQLGQGQFNSGLTMQQQQANNMREQEYLNAYLQSRGMQQGNAQFNAAQQAGNQGLAFQTQQANQAQYNANRQYNQQQTNAALSAGGTLLAHYATTQPSAPSTPNAGNTRPDANGIYNPFGSG